MLYTETIAVFRKPVKGKNTLCEKNTEVFSVKTGDTLRH
jgi:hypothetical protein